MPESVPSLPTVGAASGTWASTLNAAITAVANGATTPTELAAAVTTAEARGNHTGTQTASTVIDFAEAVDDRVAALLQAGTGVTLTYNDPAGTLTIASTGGGGGIAQSDVGTYWQVTRRPYLISGLTTGADNTSTINSALAAASPYDTVKLPAGSWTHSGTLSIPSSRSNVTFDGYGSELVATVPRYGGLNVSANGTTLKGIRHTVNWGSSTPTRGSGENTDDCPISAFSCSNLTLMDCTSTGARDSAFFLFGVNGVIARNCRGRDSQADGFHMTYGTSNVIADGIYLTNPGDDGVATVSYTGDGVICTNIQVNNIQVIDGQARGVSVVGGTDVHYTNLEIHRTRGSGVYIAKEDNGSFTTYTVTNAEVSGGFVSDSNWDTSLDVGSFTLVNQTSGAVISNVLLNGIIFQDSRKGTAYGKVTSSSGAGGRFLGAVLKDLTLQGMTSRPNAYYDGLSSTTITNGSYTYASVSAATGIATNSEGFTVYNTAGQIASSTATSTSPGLSVVRMRLGGMWATA